MMRSDRGFTLIELIVVLIIVALLVAIALPGYQAVMRKSRRAVAQTCLMQGAQNMERFYTANLSYASSVTGQPSSPPAACTQSISHHYEFAFAAPPTASTYLLKAVPIGAQASDSCGTLTLDQRGIRGSSSISTDCWL